MFARRVVGVLTVLAIGVPVFVLAKVTPELIHALTGSYGDHPSSL